MRGIRFTSCWRDVSTYRGEERHPTHGDREKKRRHQDHEHDRDHGHDHDHDHDDVTHLFEIVSYYMRLVSYDFSDFLQLTL